jgi:deoxyribonuclease IV
MSVRVREALSDSDLARKLRGKIPKEALAIPDSLTASTVKYPTLLLKNIDDSDGMSSYAKLGVITEYLLRETVISTDTLSSLSHRLFPESVASPLPENVIKAKTTQRYIDSVNNTRKHLDLLIGQHIQRQYEPEITLPDCTIVGHPDITTLTQIFEVKTSGRLKESWSQFLLQLFTYAALHPQADLIHLVLPLSACIWTWDVKNNWPKRKLYTDVLMSYKPVPETATVEDAMFQPFMMTEYPIGMHVTKQKSLRATLQGLTHDRPYQIFFTNKSVAFTVTDQDIAESLEFTQATPTSLYVHTPYLLNLCMSGVPPPHDGETEAPNYVVDCLRKHLRIGAASGLKGIVVHVGKSTDKPLETAMDNMRLNLLAALQDATPDCPLLLETPAGQGTETLTAKRDFLDFAQSIYDTENVGPKFGICIDTCHVFATGTLPLEYLSDAIHMHPHLTRLLHFNDSKEPLNSRKDRHAPLGLGHIPKEQFQHCASRAEAHHIPMIIE